MSVPTRALSVIRASSTRTAAPAAAAVVLAVAALLLPARPAVCPAVLGPRPAAAQEPPDRATPVEGGVVRVGLLLRQMDGVKRVLVVGAHPDDEDTALLSELDRHRGARAAYLSLTRGEGGQNLIGPELGKGLGLIRTGELLAARELDGAEQFFSRAYDFGYSKTAGETFRHWPRDTLLSDVVWVLRTFRPQVVVSVFSGTPADGHGQHEVAGLLIKEAFRAAADSTRFPEHLRWGADPWRVRKLYRRAWRDPESADLEVATGEYDPLLGRSPFQLAMESRSQHRSQDFGVARPPGPRFTRLVLVEDRTGSVPDAPLFAGVDTALAGVAADLPGERSDAARRHLRTYRAAVEEARRSLRALDPAPAAPALARALEAVSAAEREAARSGPRGGAARRVLGRRRRLAREALLAARGVTLRFRATDETWVPGESVRIHAELWNGGDGPLRAGPPELELPEGWRPRLLPADSVGLTRYERSRFYAAAAPVKGGAEAATEVPPGRLARWTFRVRVPPGARPSEPYFLRRDTVGDVYRWPDDPDLRARPLDPPLARGRIPVRLPGSGFSGSPRGGGRAGGGRGADPGAPSRTVAEGPVRYRGVDPAQGEFWRPVRVVPRVSVGVEPEVLVWPTGGGAAPGRRRVAVTLRSLAEDTVRAEVSLDAPEGWRTEPGATTVELGSRGAGESVAFEVVPADARAPAGGDGSGGSGGGAAREAPRPDTAGTFRTVRLAASARPVAGGASRPGADASGEGTGEDASGGDAGATAPGAAGPWRRGLTLVDYPHIEPTPLYRDARLRVERFPVRVDRDRRVGYVMGSGDAVPEAIRQLGLDVEMLGPERLRSGSLEGLDVVVLGVRAYEVRDDLRAANARLLEWVREGGTLLVQYNKYPFVEGGFAPFRATMARPHDRVTDETAPVELLHPDAPPLASPNRISARDFRGWIQERGLYFLHEWGDAFTPLLAMADPGEDPERGSLLVAPLGDGVYVYTGLAFFRQLPAGVPGAYRLFANLLSLEPSEWRGWLEEGADLPEAGAGSGGGGSGGRR